MKNDKRIFPWCFPCNFFMFLTFFLTVKFIFIFLFNGFYEPEFIFNLTPFYLLSGFNNLQLLFLSYSIVLFDLFLHLNPTHKNIRISFLPTLFLLSGTGISLTTSSFTLAVLPNLLIFLCLLFVMIIDNRYILEFEDIEKTPTSIPVKKEITFEKPVYAKPKTSAFHPLETLFAQVKNLDIKKKSSYKTPELKKVMKPSKLKKWDNVENVSKHAFSEKEIKPTSSDIDFKDVDYDEDSFDDSNIFDKDIDKKLEKLDDKLRKLKNGKDKTEDVESTVEEKTEKDSSPDLKLQKSKNMLEEIKESAAVIKKGVLKDINKPFKEFLGYEENEIINKNLIDFISFEGLSGLEAFYFNKLKHEPVSSFETVFLTKDNKKLTVKIEIKPGFINGKKADIVIIKDISS